MVRDSDPSTDLLRTVRRLVRAEATLSRTVARRTGLTVPQILCLRAVAAEGGPPTLAEVARAVDLSPGTVTGLVDRLERDGWVRRVRRDRDRRKIRLELTEAGGARLGGLPGPLDAHLVGSLQALAEDERLALAAALERVARLLEESASGAPSA